MNVTRRAFAWGTGAFSLWALSSCARGESPLVQGGSEEMKQKSFFCFDTACVIGGVMEQEQLDSAVSRCQGFEQTLSRTLETSDVARINSAAGAPVEVDFETADLIDRALAYCRASDGLFDITIGAVTRLWDFHEGMVPDEVELAEALSHVGYEGVRVERSTVTLVDPAAALDLGGIAKGYVSDVIIDELEAAGVTHAFVNLGGNVKVLGPKPDGSAWNVGIRDPSPGASESHSIARVALDGGSVVTSGLYERQFEQDGKRYWHILDPRTGYPVETDLVSATIVSDRSIDGDGYTKPLFMWGAQRSLDWAQGHDGLRILLVDKDGKQAMCPEGSFEPLA